MASRSMYLALRLITLFDLLLSLAMSVSAAPVPLPLSLMAFDNSPNPVSVNRSSTIRSFDLIQSTPFSFSRATLPRSTSLSDSDLQKYLDGASINVQDFKKVAAQSGTLDIHDLRQQSLSALSDFNGNMFGFQEALAKTAKSDKGLSNYDKQNDLESLLKGLVDQSKFLLSDTYQLVDGIPLLGPLLGPSVYQLKCIVDGILAVTEDLTDSIINAIQPALQELLHETGTFACQNGVVILGYCL